MKLTLIRHGITEGNLKKCYYGSTDLPLCEEGILELQKIRDNFQFPEAKLYFTSGMKRTEETFNILFGDKEHLAFPKLKEMEFGDFEMRSHEEMKNWDSYKAWCDNDPEINPCPNGESGKDVLIRALEVLSPIINEEKDSIGVIHGGVISVLIMHWFNLNDRFLTTPRPGNGFVITFENKKPVKYEAIHNITELI